MKMLLDDNKTVMFTGTPCQAAALNKFLKKKYNNLLNCSFLCGSYNSPKAFLSYLNSLEKQYGAKAKSICLRDKKNGWDDQNYSVRIIFHNGKEYYKAAGNDPFMKGFTLKSLFTRHSCYDCKYTGENRPFDISIADFWNIKNANPFLPRRKGVSLVLCHTQHGKDCFEKIRHKIYAEPHTFKDAEQLTLLRPVNYNFRRDIVMEQIDTTPFNVLIEQYLDS